MCCSDYPDEPDYPPGPPPRPYQSSSQTSSPRTSGRVACPPGHEKPRTPSGGQKVSPKPGANNTKAEKGALTADNIREALKFAASYLHREHQNYTIVTDGGVVETLLLKSQRPAKSMVFFGNHLDNAQRKHIVDAMAEGEKYTKVPLTKAWLNDEFLMEVGMDGHKSLTELAMEVQTVVFEEGGLKVIATRMVQKFLRIARGLETAGERPGDLEQAAAYLRWWTSQHEGRPATFATVQHACTKFNVQLPNKGVMRAIGDKYVAKYKREGLVL